MRWIEFLATGFYSGKIKPAPGTWGTLVGIPIALGLKFMTETQPVLYLILAVAFVLIASLIADLHERATGAHDPKEIVIDEIVGFIIAFAWLPATWPGVLGSFLLFRFFDIVKPFPIGSIDRRVEGGLGTVLDDVAAGLITNLILQIIFTQTAWLGMQADGLR